MGFSETFPRGGRVAWVARLAARSRYLVTTIDQILLSLFNFALNLALLRVLPPSDYGVVVLWMAVSSLALSSQNAFVNTPLNVYAASAEHGEGRRHIESAIAAVNLGLTALISLGVFLAVTLARGEWAPPGLFAALSVTAFIGTGLYREYMRSLAFSRRSPIQVILIDAPYLIISCVGVALMLAMRARQRSSSDAFLVLSLGCALAILATWPRMREMVRPRFGAVSWYRSVGGEVGWSFLGVVVNHLQTRSYVYLVTSLANIAALGMVNAVGTLYRPVGLFVTAWERSARPDLAALMAQRRVPELIRRIVGPLLLVAVANMALGVVLIAAWKPIDHYVLADRIANSERLLLPWAVASTVTAVRYMVGVCLQAARQFRFLLHAQLVSATVSVAASALILLHFGYTRVIWGTAAGEGVALITQGWRLRAVLARIADAAV